MKQADVAHWPGLDGRRTLAESDPLDIPHPAQRLAAARGQDGGGR